jgi:hypothetical protein
MLGVEGKEAIFYFVHNKTVFDFKTPRPIRESVTVSARAVAGSVKTPLRRVIPSGITGVGSYQRWVKGFFIYRISPPPG